MGKIKIIINPTAGDEKAVEINRKLESIYQEKGIETSIYETTGEDNFKELIENSMAAGYKKVVLSGGDGTISELVNGIAELEERPKIILLPSGTTNNFARMITKNKTRQEILDAIEKENLIEVKADLGQINDEYFISSIAVGLLPSVGWETDKDLKADLGSFAYLLEGLKLMREEGQESFDLRIQTEENLIIEEDIFLFIVGLSNSIFGIKTFFDEASMNDGKFHYFGLKKSNVFPEINSMMKQMSKNQERKSEDELTIQGSFKEAKIQSESEFNFLIDGEKGSSFPVELGILSDHLAFLIPGELN